ITVSVVILYGKDVCLASNEWQCMFCHQYPGLVMPEGADKFKLISIDRNRYYASPHGNAACKACHSRIESVPHTGATEVECTTACHIEDREKIETMDRSSYRVHKDDQRSVISIEDRSSCRVCHPLHPHSRNLKVRAILNMHTGYMLCGLCHLKKETLGDVIYEWKTPDKGSFTGEPYGRYTEIDPSKGSSVLEYIYGLYRRLFGDEGAAEDTRPCCMISRIAVFSEKEGTRTLVIDTEDPIRAAGYLKRADDLSGAAKEEELKYFHRDITEHEFSVACNECHSAKGILDFKQLGYDDKKCSELRDMDVKRLETEYKIFHFPHMLK
ncbi:MAG: hypothetical protein AB1499_08015, partial [Nitrospirota bacterium]